MATGHFKRRVLLSEDSSRLRGQFHADETFGHYSGQYGTEIREFSRWRFKGLFMMLAPVLTAQGEGGPGFFTIPRSWAAQVPAAAFPYGWWPLWAT